MIQEDIKYLENWLDLATNPDRVGRLQLSVWIFDDGTKDINLLDDKLIPLVEDTLKGLQDDLSKLATELSEYFAEDQFHEIPVDKTE